MMKNVIKFVFVAVLFVATVQAQELNSISNAVVNAEKVGVFQFQEKTLDYGTIKQNANGVRVFTFKNVGQAPIIITKVKASCGCTVPTKPTKAIMPGETAVIKVSYDTKRLGAFSKTITVSSNANQKQYILHIKGTVVQ